jgi:hypothetical protein
VFLLDIIVLIVGPSFRLLAGDLKEWA